MFGRNLHNGSEEENVKSLQADKQTDDGQQEIRKAYLNFELRRAKNDQYINNRQY